ncbi:MAG: hypothetical protein AB7R69_03055 [Candidatus Babeliales bacterium]
MKKIALFIALTTSVCTQTGGIFSQQQIAVTGFIQLKTGNYPQIAGFPEESSVNFLPKDQLEKAFGKKIDPETVLFPVLAWNQDTRDFAHSRAFKDYKVDFPESLDLETIKTKKDGDTLILDIGIIAFILTIQQSKDSFPSFQEILKQQVKRALGSELSSGAYEQKKLMQQGILEYRDQSYCLTELYRKPLEDFLEENK